MRIKIHPSFAVYLLYIAFSASYEACLSIMLTLLIHEAGHYAAVRFVGEQVARLEITPFGGVMTYRPGSIPHKGIKGAFVHAAGPVSNYVFLLCVCMPDVQRVLPPRLLHHLILCNASMLLFNLLPALPLDGGHILFCLGYYFLPIAKLIHWLSIAGIVVGTAGLMLAIYGLLLRQLLNCSLLIVSVYLIICAVREQSSLFAENIYAVVHERLGNPVKAMRMEHYLVAPDASLLSLISYLKEGTYVSFFFSDKDIFHELTEHAFCQAVLLSPSSTVKDAFDHSENMCEKKPNF